MKNINKVILIGQLTINLPVLIIMLGTPILIGISLSIDSFVYFLLIIGGIIAGTIIGWLWWSLIINYWKTWAFKKIYRDDWLRLYRKAIESKLIWEKNSFFNKTEIINKRQRKILDDIYQHIHYLEEIEFVNFDISTPKTIEYYINNKEIVADILIRFFVISFGILTLTIGESFLGLIICGTIFIDLHLDMIMMYHSKKPTLMLNSQGITFQSAWKKDFYFWDNIYTCKISKESKFIIIEHWSKGRLKKTKINLRHTNISNYNHLGLFIETYIDRRFLESDEDTAHNIG